MPLTARGGAASSGRSQNDSPPEPRHLWSSACVSPVAGGRAYGCDMTLSTLGERVRRLRAERGMTQEQLAERAGVSVDLVKKLEQGRRESARLTTLTKLAQALDVSRSELLDRRSRLDGGTSSLVLGLR